MTFVACVRRSRSGIESTNSLLKRVTGLGRLRVRGRRAVFASILLKVAGWNLLRAVASLRKAAESLQFSSVQPLQRSMEAGSQLPTKTLAS